MGATTAIALMAAGGASNVVGSFFSASGQRSALRNQADIAEINARVSEMSAQSELMRGQRETQAVRLRTASLKSRQRAAMAANGVDLGEGSAAEILTSTDYMGEVDAQTATDNAIRQAWGHRMNATNMSNDARMRRATASAINPMVSTFTTLLSEGGRVAASWYAMDKAGAFKPDDVVAANKTADPIQSLGAARGWWGS